MPKSKNTNSIQQPKPRGGKYEETLKVSGSFLDVMKVIIKDTDNNNQDEKSNN